MIVKVLSFELNAYAGIWSALRSLTTVKSHRSISTTLTVLALRLGLGETTLQFRIKDRREAVLDLIHKKLMIEVKISMCKLLPKQYTVILH